MRAHIFINGPSFDPVSYHALYDTIRPELTIGVDGGTEHCAQCGIRPDIIVGDLDSIPPDTLAAFTREQVKIIQHPVKKDDTDLELALDLALARGADQVHIFAALGGRWDMSMGNILTAAAAKYKQLQVRLHAGATQVAILHGGTACTFSGVPGQEFSIMPLGGEATQVTLQGCEYPLHKRDIPFGSSLGMSNIFTAASVFISLTTGTLAFITTQQSNSPDTPEGDE